MYYITRHHRHHTKVRKCSPPPPPLLLGALHRDRRDPSTPDGDLYGKKMTEASSQLELETPMKPSIIAQR